ncbi:hypothetical protein [Pseudoflavonifractor phocaeensis]|uniref:hypothetical protein n=1 Tax=Pseudoflavonifractor phocaeensis TaxID=1870988 RepID=UPI00195DB20F|nr:hypothetical protein [Pseudoflavonifractor phocaeensis]MBM6926427.1 hypothetical protein [Pseudoflavonifractor phocaeensis]
MDLYALFRHEPRAQAYFEDLPLFVQERIRARYRLVDSMERLQAMAVRCAKEG